MYTLKFAKKEAASLTKIHGEPWLVFRTPDGAPCNQYPANVFNKGRYAVCKASERRDYEMGGCEFVQPKD